MKVKTDSKDGIVNRQLKEGLKQVFVTRVQYLQH